MKRLLLLALVIAMAISTGCASVPLESPERTAQAKQFNPPAKNNAGLYIYRSTFVGQALKKDIWVNGQCVGQSANDVFFYHEVPGGKEHVLATESEFSPNELKITVESGKNYFIEQFIKMGLFVGGANLRLMDDATAKETLLKLNMAVSGTCSNTTP